MLVLVDSVGPAQCSPISSLIGEWSDRKNVHMTFLIWGSASRLGFRSTKDSNPDKNTKIVILELHNGASLQVTDMLPYGGDLEAVIRDCNMRSRLISGNSEQ